MKTTVALLVFLAGASDVWAQNVRLFAETVRTRERLDDAAELERQQKNSEALEQYLKLIADVPDEWVPMLNGQLLRPCRPVVLGRIAANPHLRNAFRERFEQSAIAAVQEAIDHKDLDELNRIVAANWPTRSTAKALDAAGDLAFERGDMAAAIHSWRQLAGPYRAGEPALPEPPENAAVARAKSLLAARLIGEKTSQGPGLSQPDNANGKNREINLPKTLAFPTNEFSTIPRAEPSAARCFAANENRAGATSTAISFLAPRGILPLIDWPICSLQLDATLPERNPIASARQLVCHPLIWSGMVIASAGDRIVAIHPDSGTVADVIGESIRREQAVEGAQTLATDGNRVFGNLNRNTLICLTRDPAAETWKWKRIWELKSTALAENATFQGCPTVADGKLFVALLAKSSNRASVIVACFSTDRPNDGPIWANTLAELQVDGDSRRTALPLLTIAGPNLICSTDAGLIVALESRTGKPAWAARYPSRGSRGLPANLLPVPRDVCPPAYANGRIFVAPADCDQVLCFDAHTGVALWDRPPVLEVVHMLGVIDDKLIITADGNYRGIGAIDVRSGKINSQWGKLDAAAPFGRGLILADYVLFPTRFNGLFVLNRAGQPIYPPTLFHNLPGGNLAFDENTLLIATANHFIRLDYREPRPK